jgi:hypothetical protein
MQLRWPKLGVQPKHPASFRLKKAHGFANLRL